MIFSIFECKCAKFKERWKGPNIVLRAGLCYVANNQKEQKDMFNCQLVMWSGFKGTLKAGKKFKKWAGKGLVYKTGDGSGGAGSPMRRAESEEILSPRKTSFRSKLGVFGRKSKSASMDDLRVEGPKF